MSALRHRLRSAAALALLDQMVVSASTFALTLLVAKILDPQSFGAYSLMLLSVQFLMSFHRAYITQPLNIYQHELTPIESQQRYGQLLRMQILLLPVAAVFLAGTSYFFYPGFDRWAACVAFTVAYSLQETVRRRFFALGQLRAVLRNDGLSYATQLPLVLVVSTVYASNEAIVLLSISASLMIGFMTEHRGLRGGRRSYGVDDISVLMQSHWQSSKWIVLSQFVFWGSSQLYPFFIGTSLSLEAAANFSIANSILNALNVVRLALANYLPAKAVQVHNETGSAGLKLFVVRHLIGYGLVSVLVVALVTVLGTLLIPALYGDKYDDAIAVLPWLGFAHVAMLVGVVTNAAAVPLERTNWIFVGNAIGAALSLTLGPLVVREYGMNGAALGLLVGAAVPAIIQGANLMKVLSGSSPEGRRA